MSSSATLWALGCRTSLPASYLPPPSLSLYPSLPLSPSPSHPLHHPVLATSTAPCGSYEFLRLLCEKGVPLPQQLAVSGFPAPSAPEAERPWNKNAPMEDPAFMEECRRAAYLPISPISPHISPYIPMSSDISPHLPISPCPSLPFSDTPPRW